MQVKYTIEDIKQQLLPEISAIKLALLTKGFFTEPNFTSINHIIWYKNETTLAKYLENETGLNLSTSFNDSTDCMVLYDCDRYTYKNSKLLS